MTKELKSCPFCGGKGELWNNKLTYRLYGVICEECDCMTPYFTTREEAIEAWNRREPIDRIAERLEAEEYDVNCNICDYDSEIDTNTLQYYEGKEDGIRSAIEIVKGACDGQSIT